MQSRDAFDRGRMRIVKRRMQRVRRESRRIVTVEFDERAHQVGGARILGRKGVGGEFLPA